MRYGNEEVSTYRRPIAAPEYLELSEHEPSTHRAGKLPPLPAKEKTERSAHRMKPHESAATPLPAPPSRTARATPQSLPVAQTHSASKSKSKSKSASQPAAPQAAAPQMPGMIDPLAVPVPPELGPTIYGWVRRLALQADLATADRVLRDGLLEISSSLAVTIIYPGQDGLWTLGEDQEIPKEAGPIVAVAQARRAVIASHTAVIPIVTTTETVAVILLTRNPRNPAYQPIEQLAMLGLAREAAAIFHHLVVQHMQKATELQADKGSLYRPEALEAHRGKSTEGAPIHISPAWVRRAYPLLIGAVLVAAAFTIFIKVPTYSTGRGLVILPGKSVTAPAAGTVEAVYVSPGQAVAKGAIIVKLKASAEQDELTNAKTELDNAARAYMVDQADDNAKKQLASIAARYNTAKSKLEQRTIRADKAGTVSDIRIREGVLVQPGDPIVTIVDGTTSMPEMLAFLPAADHPRLKIGQELQVGLAGYTKTREKAIIYEVSREGVGSSEVSKMLGPLADAMKLPPDGSWVIVKARLPGRTFETEHNILPYHHGMQATTEVKISEKPFLVAVFPAIEKYVPN